jgi:outer membrane protein OmpA-like peptidoglycan-associated protein
MVKNASRRARFGVKIREGAMGLKKLWVMSAAAALAVGAGAAVAGSLPSHGPERHGWYFGIEAGWNAVSDTSLPGSGYADLQFENYRGYFLTFGHAFEGNWRLELEGGYRENDLEKFNFIPAFGGKLKEYSGFLNLRKDIPMSKRWLLDIGAGVGLDNVRFKDSFALKDGDSSIAGQAIAGLTYRLSDHWDISATYRFLMGLDDPSLSLGGAPKSEMDIRKHTVTLGLRYGYDDPPPPPPPPAPPPAPAAPPAPKQFIIFFGFNKCNITAEADAVLSEAAAAAKSSGSASVRIVGHTDSSGSASYNQKLSECRADAAKANLVGKGVAEGSISTSGKGESELMVQTGDGVKEPQNRRATVDLQ